MPAYNAAATVRTAIESVLMQTHEQFELIVVDDCSRDATVEIVKDFMTRDSRVRLISVPTKSGAAACMNAGVKLASSPWLAIFDADAIAPEDWLARAAVIATNAQRAGWASFGGGCNYFQPTNAFERLAYAFEEDVTSPFIDTFGLGNAREPTIRGTNFFFTRACFNRVGGFNEDIRAGYDRLFLCNAIEQGCLVRFDPSLRVGHPLPGSTLTEFLRRANAMGRWRLVAADRSPIMRQMYWPIWPAIIALAVAVCGILIFFEPWQAAIVALIAAGLVAARFFRKGLQHGLGIGSAMQYAAINVMKNLLAVATYVFGLRPAGDWKRR